MLYELQQKVKEIEKSRGHDKGTVIQKSLILGEEIGELFKAIRERENISIHDKSERYSVPDELVDCLFLVLCIANRYDIDLDIAFDNKMEQDESKTYLEV